MTEQPAGTPDAVPETTGKNEWAKTLARFARYVTIRGIAVLITVAIGVYIAIWVSQLGGYADEWRRNEIRGAVAMGFRGNAAYAALSASEKEAMTEAAWAAAIAAADLDKPFIVRSFRHTAEALSLTLGEVNRMTTGGGSGNVRDILLERLPMTLILFGTANLLTFFGSLFISMFLSRRYGGFFDRVAVALVPILAAPPWFHGVFLVLIFAVLAGILPYGGILDAPPPETTFGHFLSLLKHLILPVLATVLGTLSIAVYAGRAFFLIHSSEDYVDLAKAKGLRSNTIERRYVLRPVLPAIITNFALTLIMAWQGSILTELVFNWPGVGRLLVTAVMRFEVPVIIGAVVIFAYLLALTVLLLDILYALVDPRMRLGAGGETK
ncbi:ABC transporter permease [Candidatus Bipolaricaulota bacterium]